MLSALPLAAFWTDTVGLIFSWVILLPAVATVSIIVSIIAGRGDKAADAELRSRWGAKRAPTE